MRTLFSTPISQVGESLASGTDAGTVDQSAVSNVANIHYTAPALDGDFTIDDAYADVASLTDLKAGIYHVLVNFSFKSSNNNQVWDFKLYSPESNAVFDGSQATLIRSTVGTPGSGSFKPQIVSIVAIVEILADDTTLTLQAQNNPAGGGTIISAQFSFNAVRLYAVTSDAAF